MDNRTIVGIATSGGENSINVVRISGDRALDLANKIFVGFNNRPLMDIKPFTMRYGFIMDGDLLIDEVILSYFKGPRSYTGENVVEISCHGGNLPVRKIMELLLKMGAYLASPGEFTKRAFLNGRIDLSQAEAVMEIIGSRTDAALKAAQDQSRGSLSEKIRGLRSSLLNILARIEVTLDFPDEDLERSSDLKIREELYNLNLDIDKLYRTSQTGKLLKDGMKVVIAGKPNVGKSSLLNALLEENRAIVTDIPGTTRDVIEEFISIDGIPIRIRDTAGIRQTHDEVEKIGVEKSYLSIDDADLVILVLDSSNLLNNEDKEILEKTKDSKRIILLNKSDLDKKIIIDEDLEKEALNISAKNNFGINEVKDKISEILKDNTSNLEEILITNERHKDALLKAKISIEDAINGIDNMVPMDLITIDVNDAWYKLGEITGDTLRDDLVDRIFSGFCIGK